MQSGGLQHRGGLAGQSKDGRHEALRHGSRQPQARAIGIGSELIGINMAGVPRCQVAQVELQLAIVLRSVAVSRLARYDIVDWGPNARCRGDSGWGETEGRRGHVAFSMRQTWSHPSFTPSCSAETFTGSSANDIWLC